MWDLSTHLYISYKSLTLYELFIPSQYDTGVLQPFSWASLPGPESTPSSSSHVATANGPPF
jgi:hypothetical protein